MNSFIHISYYNLHYVHKLHVCSEKVRKEGSGVNMSESLSSLVTLLRKSMTSCTERLPTWVRGSTVEDSSAAITRPAHTVSSKCAYVHAHTHKYTVPILHTCTCICMYKYACTLCILKCNVHVSYYGTPTHTHTKMRYIIQYTRK